MRISDWSSDVCSSDRRGKGERGEIDMRGQVDLARLREGVGEAMRLHRLQRVACGGAAIAIVDRQQRAAIDRQRVVEGKSVSVRVDLGGSSIIKKKKNKKKISSNKINTNEYKKK